MQKKWWKFEQNRIIRSRVMNFQSFIKYGNGRLWDPWYWQLRQYLWCHWAQLSIDFVYKIPLTFIFLKGQLSSWPNSFRKACRIILTTSYWNYKQGENVLFIKKIKNSENLCTKPMESSPLWHHRYGWSCQHQGSP